VGPSLADGCRTVAYLEFCEGGGRAKDARFEAPEAPMGWSVGRGCPLPTEEGVWGGGCAPSPEIFFKFFLVQCVQKIFVFRPKGGPSPSVPPLNTPLLPHSNSTQITDGHVRQLYCFRCMKANEAITADTAIAYITHDDRPNLSSASSRHGAKRTGCLCIFNCFAY